MSINLELIDELRKRANVSYEEAKEALEKSNGDLVEALVYLEKQNKINKDDTNCEHKHGFKKKFKELIKKANETRFIVTKGEKVVLSIPVTLAIIITAIATYLVIFALVIALFTGHKFKFESKDSDTMKVNETLDKISVTVDNIKKSWTDDSAKDTSATNE